MYLRELYGRIGQMLQEHGDMKVQRARSLKIDGIVGTNLNNFIDFSSNNFSILEEYIQKQIDENTFEEKKVGQRLIIDIPFN
jgi:hypothetical protein